MYLFISDKSNKKRSPYVAKQIVAFQPYGQNDQMIL
jgi:hypothetical protein